MNENNIDFSYDFEVGIHGISENDGIEYLKSEFPSAVINHHEWNGQDFSNWIHVEFNGVKARVNCGLGGWYLDAFKDNFLKMIVLTKSTQAIHA